MLVALTSDPDKRLTESVHEVQHLIQFRGNWRSMSDQIQGFVADTQKLGTKYEVLATIPIDDKPVDVLLLLDFNKCWVPYHRNLYDSQDTHAHGNKLRQPGRSVDDFITAWNWSTQFSQCFVPTGPGQLITVSSIEMEDRTIHIDKTVEADVRRVVDFSKALERGGNEQLLVVEAATDHSRGLPFGEFPTDHTPDPNKGRLTIYGSTGSESPLWRQVTLKVHLDTVASDVKSYRRQGGTTTLEKDKAGSVAFKLPLEGKSERVIPLAQLADRIGMRTVPAKTFDLQFPAIDRLPDSAPFFL